VVAGKIPLIRATRTFSPGRRKGVTAGITCLSPTGERSRSAKRAGGEGRAAQRRKKDLLLGADAPPLIGPAGHVSPVGEKQGVRFPTPTRTPLPFFPGEDPGPTE